MLNYTVKIRSLKDLMEIRKLADRYELTGKINQNGFHGDLKSVVSNILYLPLDEASIEIDNYRESQVPYIAEAFNKFAA